MADEQLMMMSSHRNAIFIRKLHVAHSIESGSYVVIHSFSVTAS
jgi:hypothetical protein